MDKATYYKNLTKVMISFPFYATFVGDPFAVLKNELDINRCLVIASVLGHTATTKRLISFGPTCFGTPLKWACKMGWVEVAKLLLPHCTVTSIYLKYACRSGNIPLIGIIFNAGARDWTLGFLGACQGGFTNILENMFKHRKFPLEKGAVCAAKYGNYFVIKLLYEKGLRDLHNSFIIACQRGHFNLVKYITELDVEYPLYSGIHEAEENGFNEIANFLINKN